MVLFAVGWGPLFFAEFVRADNPQLDASDVLQHYALLFMPITEICTLLAVVVCPAAVARFLFGRGPESGEGEVIASRQWCGPLLCCCFLAMVSCGSKSQPAV